jgi:1-deoxy-D-xylulose 5-phosphate reductoisomerase
VAVADFLDDRIGFLDIQDAIRHALDTFEDLHSIKTLKTVEKIEELDKTVREITQGYTSRVMQERKSA